MGRGTRWVVGRDFVGHLVEAGAGEEGAVRVCYGRQEEDTTAAFPIFSNTTSKVQEQVPHSISALFQSYCSSSSVVSSPSNLHCRSFRMFASHFVPDLQRRDHRQFTHILQIALQCLQSSICDLLLNLLHNPLPRNHSPIPNIPTSQTLCNRL